MYLGCQNVYIAGSGNTSLHIFEIVDKRYGYRLGNEAGTQVLRLYKKCKNSMYTTKIDFIPQEILEHALDEKFKSYHNRYDRWMKDLDIRTNEITALREELKAKLNE